MTANATPKDLFRAMLRIRRIEEAIAERYPAPTPAEQTIRCPVHLSIGQEAVPVGVAAALRPDDKFALTHRCHAQYLAKGGALKPMIAEMLGRETGCCGGRGGSMHLHDAEAGVMLSLPIVASAIPIGVGVALALRQQGSDAVAAAFFGDGAVEEGVFHESMNFAALKKLPILFVLENNLYSVYTGLPDRQPDRPLADLGKAHAVPVIQGDGNDVRFALDAAREATARARAGGGPTLMVFDTYRWREHCGPNYDNDIGYRTEAEFLEWKARCPIERLRKSLGLSEAEEAAMERAIQTEIEDAFAFAEASPHPDPDTAGDMVLCPS